MKFLTPLILAGTAAASLDFTSEYAAEIIKRQSVTVQTIVADFQNITNNTFSLGESLVGISEPIQALQVNTYSQAIQAGINQTIADAKLLPPLDQMTGIKIIMPIQGLAFASNLTITNLINAKEFFVKNGFQQIVLQGLQLQNLTSYQLNEILVQKSPEQTREQSAALGAPTLNSLAQAIAVYSNDTAALQSAQAAAASLAPSSSSSAAQPTSYVGYGAMGAVALAMAAAL